MASTLVNPDAAALFALNNFTMFDKKWIRIFTDVELRISTTYQRETDKKVTVPTEFPLAGQIN